MFATTSDGSDRDVRNADLILGHKGADINKKYSSLEDGEVREEDEDDEDSDYHYGDRYRRAGVSESEVRDGEEDFFYGGGK